MDKDKVVYSISGTLPAPWEDFLCVQGDFPHVTLVGTQASEPVLADIQGDEPCDDNWLDITLETPEVTETAAQEAIARVIGVAPELIVIRQDGIIQAV